VLEARITPVRSLATPLTQRGAFKLHAGAAERNAFLRLYQAREVPRAGAFARVTLSEPLVLDVGDRFVLRESGRRETVAGGVVLDPHPHVGRASRRPAGSTDGNARRGPSSRGCWCPNAGGALSRPARDDRRGP
jgi:selenocysteine-specific elongation factor